jgi:hypothetical protein
MQMRKFRILVFILPVVLLFSYGCKPVIYEFHVTPRVIGPDDSVRVTWKVSGSPTLSVQDQHIGTDTIYRKVTLTVRKAGKKTYRDSVVTVFYDGTINQVGFQTVLHSDTLIAAGMKNTARWGNDFVVSTVDNPYHRKISIIHSGKSVYLNALSKGETTLNGTPVSGNWEIRTLLTPAEKADPHIDPLKLSILITIKHK